MATKPKTPGHHRYKCKVCGKIDRRGRTVAHILKKHVSLDRVPYSCSLCNFRCTDKKDLHGHLYCYARHVEEMARTGITDLTQVLNQSANPVKVEELMVDLDSGKAATSTIEDTSIFESQENLDPTLPDWLSDIVTEKVPEPTRVIHIPSPKRTPLQQVTSQSMYQPFDMQTLDYSALISSFQPDLFTSPQFPGTSNAGPSLSAQTPRVVNVLNAPHCPRATVTTEQYVTTPALASQDLVVPMPMKPSAPPAPVNQTPVLPVSVNPSPVIPALVNPVPVVPAPVKQNPQVSAASSTRSSTPVQDEPVNILPTLLHVDGTDPLLAERDDSRQPPAKRQKTTEGSREAVSLDKESVLALVNAINKSNQVVADALKQQTRKIEALDRTLRCVLDEIHSVGNGIQAVARNTRPPTQLQSAVRVPSPKSKHQLKSKKHDRRN